jgi:hypothetical protein
MGRRFSHPVLMGGFLIAYARGLINVAYYLSTFRKSGRRQAFCP